MTLPYEVTCRKRYISTSVGPMATKLARMAYDKGSPLNDHMTQESLNK